MEMWQSEKEVVISIGNQTITSKKAICTMLNISTPPPPHEMVSFRGEPIPFKLAPEPLTVTMEFKVLDDNFMTEMFDDTYKPKIRNKKVKDCTVKELLFACRQKVILGK